MWRFNETVTPLIAGEEKRGVGFAMACHHCVGKKCPRCSYSSTNPSSVAAFVLRLHLNLVHSGLYSLSWSSPFFSWFWSSSWWLNCSGRFIRKETPLLVSALCGLTFFCEQREIICVLFVGEKPEYKHSRNRENRLWHFWEVLYQHLHSPV